MGMTLCRAVNLRREKPDVYIGRPSIFGNPYTVEAHGRELALELFAQYFADRIERDPAFREQVLALAGKTLGCFCKPAACHGDVIADWVNQNRPAGSELK